LQASALEQLRAALAQAAGTEVELERPPEAEHGDYATNAALKLAPVRKKPPRELAEELARSAAALGVVERAEVAGPGFVNLFLAAGWYREALAGILDAGDAFGAGSAEQAERVQVELVSANPTGPLHVGHARNGAYGDSVGRLLALAGHDVSREHYVNDVGRQIGLFEASVTASRTGVAPPPEGYHGDYIHDLAALDGDPVDNAINAIEEELERFRIHVDSWRRQSELQQKLPDLLPRLDTYEAEETLWTRTSAYGDDKDRPLVRSADGSYLYFAADAAYVEDKLTRFDRAIYVLGADHHGYVRRLKAAAAMLGFEPDRVEVLIYQLVHVTEKGAAKRMSKRRGDVVFLSELVDKVGVDAARWYLVSRGHDQTIEIDVDLARERSEKNPVYYVQYAHARIAAILRNAEEAQPGEDEELQPQERELVKRLLEFPQLATEAAERRAPHMVPVYAIRVADDFHRFYHHCRVIDEGVVRPFRRDLCIATQRVVARCLDLIGVEAPERM